MDAVGDNDALRVTGYCPQMVRARQPDRQHPRLAAVDRSDIETFTIAIGARKYHGAAVWRRIGVTGVARAKRQECRRSACGVDATDAPGAVPGREQQGSPVAQPTRINLAE